MDCTIPLPGNSPLSLGELSLRKIVKQLWAAQDVVDEIHEVMTHHDLDARYQVSEYVGESCRVGFGNGQYVAFEDFDNFDEGAENCFTSIPRKYSLMNGPILRPFIHLQNIVAAKIGTLKLPSMIKNWASRSAKELGQHLEIAICRAIAFDLAPARWFSDPEILKWLLMNLQYDDDGRINWPKTDLAALYDNRIPVNFNLQRRFIRACYYSRIDKMTELRAAMGKLDMTIKTRHLHEGEAKIFRIWRDYFRKVDKIQRGPGSESTINAVEQSTYGKAFEFTVQTKNNAEAIEVLWKLMTSEERARQIENLLTFDPQIQFKDYWVFQACSQKMNMDQRESFYTTHGLDLVNQNCLTKDVVQPVLRYLGPFFCYYDFSDALEEVLFEVTYNQYKKELGSHLSHVAKCLWDSAPQHFHSKILSQTANDDISKSIREQLLKILSE